MIFDPYELTLVHNTKASKISFSATVLGHTAVIGLFFMSCTSVFHSQGNLSELGKLLMQGSFSVWTEHKKGHAKVKDLARFKPMQRHLFLHEKALLFCKRREENGEGYEKAPSYSFKQSLSVSSRTHVLSRLSSIVLLINYFIFLATFLGTDGCSGFY